MYPEAEFFRWEWGGKVRYINLKSKKFLRANAVKRIKRFDCPEEECNLGFKSRTKMLDHKHDAHDSAWKFCKGCGMVFTDILAKRYHHKLYPHLSCWLRCSYRLCNFHTSRYRKWKDHVTMKHYWGKRDTQEIVRFDK